MRRLPILKTLTTILFVISMLGIIFGIPAFFLLIIMPERVPLKLNGVQVTSVDAELIILLICLIVGYALFVYALYMFKMVLALFEKKRIFDVDVIRYFDQIGKAILAGYLICAVPMFFYNMLAQEELELGVYFGFNSAFFTIGLALFFMVLSEVFLVAKNLKEENDLTV